MAIRKPAKSKTITKTGKIKKALMSFLSTLVVCVIGIYYYFSYVNSIKVVSTEGISQMSASVVRETVNSDANIAMIQIVTADPTRNVRKIVYAYSRDQELQSMYSNFVSSHITLEVPLFTSDDANNVRMVRIINHEFVCSPFKDTLSYKFYPEAAKKVSTVCSISIPPSYGYFRGIVGILLKRPPTPYEEAEIRAFVKDLAARLFEEIK